MAMRRRRRSHDVAAVVYPPSRRYGTAVSNRRGLFGRCKHLLRAFCPANEPVILPAVDVAAAFTFPCGPASVDNRGVCTRALAKPPAGVGTHTAGTPPGPIVEAVVGCPARTEIEANERSPASLPNTCLIFVAANTASGGRPRPWPGGTPPVAARAGCHAVSSASSYQHKPPPLHSTRFLAAPIPRSCPLPFKTAYAPQFGQCSKRRSTLTYVHLAFTSASLRIPFSADLRGLAE